MDVVDPVAVAVADHDQRAMREVRIRRARAILTRMRRLTEPI